MMTKLGALSSILAAASLAPTFDPAVSCGVANAWDDDVGALELADYVGARRRTSRRMARRQPNARDRLIPKVPGVPSIGLALQPLGLGATAFTASSGTLLQLQGTPLRPFLGQRMILDQTRTGTTATGLTTVTRLDVGTDNQLVGYGAISVGAFAANAVDANVKFKPCSAGIPITVQLNISAAPGSSDRVDIGGTLFGTTIG